jgi:hypothetical protein
MDFSKLSSNDRTAVVASAVVVITGLISLVNGWGGLLVVALLGAAAMLAIAFMSQSPGSRLPGSKGSLMLVAGGGAAAAWVIATLTWLGWIFEHIADVDTLLFVIGLAASLVMGWAGWQAFQAEGGKFRVGSSQHGTG